MNIELKNVKYAEFASHETSCFSATVYIDGKSAGTVENDGQGGMNFYRPRALLDALHEHCMTLPSEPTMWNQEFTPDPDTVIAGLLQEWLVRRDLKRDLKVRVVFVKEDGKLYNSPKYPAVRLAQFLSLPELPQTIGAVKILNLLPMDEAVAVAIKAAA